METVEFRLRVPAHPELNSQIRLALLDDGTLTEMPSDIAGGLIQREDRGAPYVFKAMLEDTGVFITEDWVVMIVGRSVLDCVSALCVLISLIADLFQTPISVALITLRNKNTNPLYRWLARRSLLARIRSSVWWILGALLSGAIGAWIGSQVFGG